MWIDRKLYDDLRLDHVKSNEEARVLSEQNRALQTTLDWLRVRVTQLEMERAQLLYNFMGIKIPTPRIETAGEADPHSLNAVPNFDDMGDAEASKMGVGWNLDGTVSYSSPTNAREA